jgi:hypothetical protein
VWTKTADGILEILAAYCQRIMTQGTRLRVNRHPRRPGRLLCCRCWKSISSLSQESARSCVCELPLTSADWTASKPRPWGDVMSDSSNGSSSSGDGNWWSRMSRSEQVIAAIIAGIFAIAVALIKPLSDSAPKASPEASATVGTPVASSPGKPVATPLTFDRIPDSQSAGKILSITLSGKVPRNEYLWIYVHHAGHYYVQGPPSLQAPGIWSMPAVNLGSTLKSDVDSWYTIYAVLANPAANKLIRKDYGSTYDVNYGTSTIPGGSGIEKDAYVNVYRNH